MTDTNQEAEVISLDELTRIENEFRQEQPKTQEQIQQETNAIMEQAIQDSKRQLDGAVKDVQMIYIMGAVLIAIIGLAKFFIGRWIKKQLTAQKTKPKLRKIK